MLELTQSIIVALKLLAFTGECTEADAYPEDMARNTVGYVVIDDCVLPELESFGERQIVDTFLDFAGD